MKNFFKGIVVGFGGISPGLSGSVMLILFGLYQKVLEAFGSLHINFKKNIRFLFPIVSGMVIGLLSFSNVINYFLNNHEMVTRYCFLGLILGTVPVFFREVRKEGYTKKNAVWTVIAMIVSISVFTMNTDKVEQITDPSMLQCVVLGVAVITTMIIPGLDPMVVLSSLGYYEVYISSLAKFDLRVLAPMAVGIICGGLVISYVMTKMFKNHYAMTFSIVFGLFIPMIPGILNESCKLGANVLSVLSIVFLIIGFIIAYYFGDLENNNKKIKKLMGKV